MTVAEFLTFLLNALADEIRQDPLKALLSIAVQKQSTLSPPDPIIAKFILVAEAVIKRRQEAAESLPENNSETLIRRRR